MMIKMSRKQYEELCFLEFLDIREYFNEKLEEISGITAKPYNSYQYYDSSGHYIGDSKEHIMESLPIKIEDT